MFWKWFPWINMVLGLWLIAMPFAFATTPDLVLSSIVIGLVIVFMAFFAWTGVYLLNSPAWAWASWIVLVHGLGAIALPFLFSETGMVMAGYVVTGFLVTFLAFMHWWFNVVERPIRQN